MKRPWIAFFSQSGSEIANLTRYFGHTPDCIVTNKQDLSDVHFLFKKDLEDKAYTVTHIPVKPTVEDYMSILKQYKNPIVTLHGYLRIIPAEICSKYEIYNLHPGLIDRYPELKGKDPQQRAIDGKYDIVGCVLHKVIPEVDCGKIIDSYPLIIKGRNHDVNSLTAELKNMALIMWGKFLKSYVN
jgi:folate-dependent phosphoribosylglycinamide formyltransferase PurN